MSVYHDEMYRYYGIYIQSADHVLNRFCTMIYLVDNKR